MTSTSEQQQMTLERLSQFGDAWVAGDLDMLMTFVTDDCVYAASVGPEPGTIYRGREEVREGFAAMIALDRGREREGGPTMIFGNLGIAQWSIFEEGPDGQRAAIRGCDIFEFEGDKIRKKDAYRKVFGPAPGTGSPAR